MRTPSRYNAVEKSQYLIVSHYNCTWLFKVSFCDNEIKICFNRFIKAYKKFGAPLERYGHLCYYNIKQLMSFI